MPMERTMLMNKKKKRITAMLMAVFLSLCANGSMVFASDANEADTEELKVYDATVRTD